MCATMTNHPNRSKKSVTGWRSPTTDAILARRKEAKLTQKQSADLVCSTSRAWQMWESGERPMHPGTWKLYWLCTEPIIAGSAAL